MHLRTLYQGIGVNWFSSRFNYLVVGTVSVKRLHKTLRKCMDKCIDNEDKMCNTRIFTVTYRLIDFLQLSVVSMSLFQPERKTELIVILTDPHTRRRAILAIHDASSSSIFSSRRPTIPSLGDAAFCQATQRRACVLTAQKQIL